MEQTLVPEGVFALQLAEALKIGHAEDEAQAEKLLGELGIEPKNGWIAEYPVTPSVIGDIDAAVATAADSHKLSMPKEQALKIVADVKNKLGLKISAEPSAPLPPGNKPVETKIYKYIDKNGGVHITNEYDSIPEEYRNRVIIMDHEIELQSTSGINMGADTLAAQYAANPGQDVIDDYYDTLGPPAITYYPPPGPYYYLYSWTPYPFWYSGYFFTGFFVLNDFHRHMHFHDRRFAVGNHFHNDNFRHRFLNTATNAGIITNAPTHNRIPGASGFYPPQLRNNARAILTFSQNRRLQPGFSAGPQVPASGFSPRIPSYLNRNYSNTFNGITPMPPLHHGFSQNYNRPLFNPPTYGQRQYRYTPPPPESGPRVAIPRQQFGFPYLGGNSAWQGVHGGSMGGGFSSMGHGFGGRGGRH